MNARQKRIPAGGVAEDMESIRTRSRLWSRGVPVADVILAEWVQADRDRAALLAEVDRIREAIGAVLEHSGCSCDCGHGYTEHDPECERCLACEISEALTPAAAPTATPPRRDTE